MGTLNRETQLAVLEAFSSLTRTDYISLDDLDKLHVLQTYYVDYFHKIPLILQEQDNIIIGRRGTGKTTLLYRAYVECLATWDVHAERSASSNTNLKRVLPIYIDLNGCAALAADEMSDETVQIAFLQEIARSLGDQIEMLWRPENSALWEKIFGHRRDLAVLQNDLDSLAKVLVGGRPFSVASRRQAEVETRNGKSTSVEMGVQATGAQVASFMKSNNERVERVSAVTVNQVTVGDLVAALRRLRTQAGLSCIMIFVDEFSALTRIRQRQLAHLLKALLGNKAGIYFKLAAITDNYDVGDILLPRDLTPIGLDLDDVVESEGNLSDGMTALREMTKLVLETRLRSMVGLAISDVFQDPDATINDLALSAMGVTRTMGYVLQKVWTSVLGKKRSLISRSDALAGIRMCGMTYLETLLGAIRAGTLPGYYETMWLNLINRAQKEKRTAQDRSASHFLVLPFRESHLSKLSEYLVVHLLKKARTTKKDTTKRHLYSFDYGLCQEFGLGFSTDKNIIRQQRFVYDEEITCFDKEFDIRSETTYLCRRCQVTYTKDQLYLERLGIYIDRCPRCNQPLLEQRPMGSADVYTEEERKIIGSIYAPHSQGGKLARDIADEVGCSVQKVSSFGRKIERDGRILRVSDESEHRLRYLPVRQAR